ncbi:MAG TPA: hypothetical protein VFB51_05015 [Solirubrobacterales bacterium]|nr:hypothetical protein [Solirubrobacterales bacterium]
MATVRNPGKGETRKFVREGSGVWTVWFFAPTVYPGDQIPFVW